MSGETSSSPTAPHDVFISYASPDAAVADAVVGALETAGLRCWIAPRDVVPGTFYAGAIVHAIEAAKAVVLVLSASAASSQHVLREVECASSRKHPIVSFRIDLSPMPADLEYFLNTSHWLDASSIGVDRSLPRLVDAVRLAVASARGTDPERVTPAAGSAPTGASRNYPATKTAARRRRAFFVLAAAISVGLTYLIVDRLWLPKRKLSEAPASAATMAANEKSIAVLPFADMSEKRDQEYFADGMSEEILDLLAKIPGLTVIGRTSSFQFKGRNEDLRTIGKQLNAAHVLEGSVRKSGDRVRVTAQLIDTRTGAHQWSETYDRDFGDVLKLQDEIAANLVRALELTVAPDYLPSRGALRNADSYEFYLRGRHALDRFDGIGFDQATRSFQQALTSDPTSGLAAAWLAYAYELQGEWQFAPPGIAFENARHTAELALRLDPGVALPHVVLGSIHVVYDWDWAGAERELGQALVLAPRDSIALGNSARLLLTVGRLDEALAQMNAAIAADPLRPNAHLVLAWIQLRLGDLAAAEAAIRRALDIRPTLVSAHLDLGTILLERGQRDAALAEMQRETIDGGRLGGLAIVYFALGRKADSDAALARMIRTQSKDWAFAIAEAYAFRGERELALQWLERAYAQKDAALFIIKGDPPLKALEPDPRFRAFLRKMNLPE